MSMTDPIADYLTRIRNASRAKHRKVDIPASKLKRAITKILLNEGFIENYRIVEFEEKQYIKILLKYYQGEGVITGIDRVSRPGIRKYVGKDEIPRVFDGLGITILSTSKGVMSGKKAKRIGLGGEVLCNVW
ncbi:MAG: 30S ribosomal protein S8 [candidate division Zixibacteria bacterium]|nr:30S ribosomal protein S8 [Candidatus Tariuqbacter arcticus]